MNVGCQSPAWADLLGGKRRADVVEHRIDARSEGLRPGSCTESNEGHDKRVFDEVLTVLFFQHLLKPGQEIEQCVFHNGPLLRLC